MTPIWLYRILLLLILFSEGIYIGIRWVNTGHPPILGTFEESISASWSILLFSLIMDSKGRFSFITIPFALLTLLYGIQFDTAERPLIISEQSYWVYFHALFAWIAYGFYTLSAISALYILVKRGDDAYAKNLLNKGLLNGFFSQTVMFVLGSYYSSRLHGTWWKWDPVEYLFIVSCFLYAIPIHGRVFSGWREERVAVWVLIGFIVTLILYWGLIYFPWATYHIFDPEWKTHLP